MQLQYFCLLHVLEFNTIFFPILVVIPVCMHTTFLTRILLGHNYYNFQFICTNTTTSDDKFIYVFTEKIYMHNAHSQKLHTKVEFLLHQAYQKKIKLLKYCIQHKVHGRNLVVVFSPPPKKRHKKL